MQQVTSFVHAPTRQAALDAATKINPTEYSKSRNFLNGAVTGLSPWITHGFLSVREAARLLMEKHRLGFEDKLIFEFAWREFFKHVHGELGNQIFLTFDKRFGPGATNWHCLTTFGKAARALKQLMKVCDCCTKRATCTTMYACGLLRMWCTFAKCTGRWARTGCIHICWTGIWLQTT